MTFNLLYSPHSQISVTLEYYTRIKETINYSNTVRRKKKHNRAILSFSWEYMLLIYAFLKGERKTEKKEVINDFLAVKNNRLFWTKKFCWSNIYLRMKDICIVKKYVKGNKLHPHLVSNVLGTCFGYQCLSHD